jgi:UPF0042 nucleotide-binding protein
MSEYVVVTGLSGGGRTEMSRTLEDLGWFIIDNVPASLIPKVGELASAPGSTIERVGLGVPFRPDDDEILPAIAALRANGNRVRIVFLDASTERLVQRYESARRRHPFATEVGLAVAIEAERDALRPLKEVADIVIDTSGLNVHELRARINELFGEDHPDAGMRTRVMSFGYKHGVPLDVDVVIDCRFLPNPHWVPELRPMNGRDEPVRDYVLSQDGAKEMLEAYSRVLKLTIEGYQREGKHYMTLAVGCTGGKHRSVAMAEQFAERLRGQDVDVHVVHRDVGRE